MTCPKCHGDMQSYERGGYGDYSHHGKHYKKRKKNFLEELFD
jgi:Zn-finger nucleic acid-binding protein